MSYKQHKLMRTVREFDTVGDRYLINGIDLAEAIFFSRAPQGMYEPIPKGSYRIVNEGGSTYLEIIDTVLLAKSEKFQVVYQFASMSSTYEVDFNVDVDTLKNRYNEVVEDVKAIFAYVKSNMMTADGQDVAVILPQLDTDEVWVRTADGYKGFNIGDLEQRLEDIITRFTTIVQEAYNTLEIKRLNAIHSVETTRVVEEAKIVAQGNVQYGRINGITVDTSNNMEKIWRMFSIVTGSQRYLSGGVLSERNQNMLERTADGGKLSERVGAPRRIYVGGSLADRIQFLTVSMDLGGK